MITAPTAKDALLAILDNQARRTEAALAHLHESVYRAAPGGEAHSILEIGAHLVHLQKFQLSLLGSPLAEKIEEVGNDCPLDVLRARLTAGFVLVRQAVEDHEVADWTAVPASPRPGPWGNEPTLNRFVRPLNDFVNHLGAIRTIRRILGNPADNTQ